MDERFVRSDGADVYNGNELILKGALEAGVGLITGYPGSPISDLFDACHANRDLLKKHGIVAEIANNEALAVARLNGSRMAGIRGMAAMKSVGLNVASDGLALGNLAEPHNGGGALVVVGDDPWIESTQINNDSRYLSQHLHMPVVEPSTFQEIKDWIAAGLDLSGRSNLYLTYLLTTPQADGGGTVWAQPNRYPDTNHVNRLTLQTSAIDLDRNVLLPPRTWDREASLPQRFERLLSEARSMGLNRQLYARSSPIGFISSGMAYAYLEQALSDLDLSGEFPILKLGLTYPVDPKAVLELAQQVEQIFVIEEKRGFIEQQVVQILHGTASRVWGKTFPEGQPGIPEKRGLSATILTERLAPVLRQWAGLPPEALAGLEREMTQLAELTSSADESPLPVRTPTFCPGCPHRDSSALCLEIKKNFQDPAYMKKRHGRGPVDLVFHGETGCFSMLMFEPNQALMHNYSGMGLGGGTGAGANPFITNKQVVFLGDSTFFHSGMVALSDSIKNGQDITYIILDNKTTAMTGHQPTPGNDFNLLGDPVRPQHIEMIVRALGDHQIPVTRVNPEYRDAYRELLEDTILAEGVKVIIADKECGLVVQRQKRRQAGAEIRRSGFLREERHIHITPEVCEYCLECTKNTGCPGLTIEETDFGPKIATDRSACVSDGACARVKACPSFEEVTIQRTAPPDGPSPLMGEVGRSPGGGELKPSYVPPTPPPAYRLQGPAVGHGKIDPQASPTRGEGKSFEPYQIYIAGVGGMGAGLLVEILVRAAHTDGWRVLFSDKKGLAIRNGAVFGHVVLSRSGGTRSPLIASGKADLLIGLDALEAARAADPSGATRIAHPGRTSAVVDTGMHPTVRMLLGTDRADGRAWLDRLIRQVKPGACWGQDVSSLAEQRFGDRTMANSIMVGVAYQRGLLPLSLEALRGAIRKSVGAFNRDENLRAFDFGRRLAADPSLVPVPPAHGSAAELIQEKFERLASRYGRRTAQGWRVLAGETIAHLELGGNADRDVVLRTYELVRFGGLATARRYAAILLQVQSKDRGEWSYQATRAVIDQAFRVMAIKDEFYVAELLTSAEKRERDARRFGIDPARGDRVIYRHFNRPEFALGKWRWTPDLVTRDWMLGIVKRLRGLRTLWPGFHRREQAFRDWYLALVERFEAESEVDYERWVQILNVPQDVRGYREVRYPLMDQAMHRAELLLRRLQHTIVPPPSWGRTKEGGSASAEPPIPAPCPPLQGPAGSIRDIGPAGLPPQGGKEGRS